MTSLKSPSIGAPRSQFKNETGTQQAPEGIDELKLTRKRINQKLFAQLQKPHIQGLIDRDDLETISRALFDSQLYINPIPYAAMADVKKNESNAAELDDKMRTKWLFVLFENETAKRIFYSEKEVKQWLQDLPPTVVKRGAARDSSLSATQISEEDAVVPSEDDDPADESINRAYGVH